MNKNLISEWHTLSKFQITEETLIKRYNAFEVILAHRQKGYWIDLVRLFLDLSPNEKNVTHFINSFQAEDDSFPRLKIEKLTKALAAMAITAKIQIAIATLSGDSPIVEEAAGAEEEEETENQEDGDTDIELAHIICSALMNATFLKQIKIETKVPIIKNALDFLSMYSPKDRMVNLNDHENTLEAIENRVSDDEDEITSEETLSVVHAARALIRTNDIQREELDVLWWIFGEYSDIADDYFSNIERGAMAVISAREIHDLSPFTSAIPSYKHLIRKVISSTKSDNATNNELTVKDCIQLLSPEIKTKILGNYASKIDDLTPCLNALIKSDEHGVSKGIRLNINEKLDVGIIAAQFYMELIFLSAN